MKGGKGWEEGRGCEGGKKGGKGWEEGRGCEGGKKEGREGTSIREGGREEGLTKGLSDSNDKLRVEGLTTPLSIEELHGC